MSDQRLLEIYRARQTAEDKYAYFLLAAAASGIGLAASQTKADALSWTHLPLGFGVACWSISFYCGCRHLEYVASNLFANFSLIQVQKGEHPDLPHHPALAKVAEEGIREAIKKNGDFASRYANNQFRYLVTGGIAYVVWHIFGMYLRGKGAA
jgi:hypothetical protein